MTFEEKYRIEKTWHGKVMVMEIYHLAMTSRDRTWTISKTASHFNCSIGLVSENLKLADALHKDDKLCECKYRDEALTKIRKKRYE